MRMLFLTLMLLAPAVGTAQEAAQPAILEYIHNGWDTLTRSMVQCDSLHDPKVAGSPVLYLPAELRTPPQVAVLEQRCGIRIAHLPRPIRHLGDVLPAELPTSGLLYLPNPYVVPGGRFNEQYGWDSYFILLGLLADHRASLARGMVENFFFEIDHYGALLNANRTYFFTRSQPPLLSSMIRDVFESTHDLRWLAGAYLHAQRDYALWISPMHRAGDTGLARYKDLAGGPVPEMADDSTYYPDVIRWLIAHPAQHPEYLVPDASPAQLAQTSCDPRASRICAAALVEGHRLSATFYTGDRAMRESGFDTTFRFGPFSGSTQNFAPVGLNALLFAYEQNMAFFATQLHRPAEARQWLSRAVQRHAAIDQRLWDPARGLYLDFDFTTGERVSYPYLTTFYPLWAGLASPAQAAAVHAHLRDFEQPGGVATSTTVSGTQWDAPYGWAPLQWFAVQGLERAGYAEDAGRIAHSFSRTVEQNYKTDGTIREKYNVVSGSANVAVAAGYKANVVGFGWTNAVYLLFNKQFPR